MANTTYTTTGSLSSFYTINLPSSGNGSYNYGTIGTSAGSNGTFYSSISASSTPPSMTVSGDLKIDGNMTVKGKDIVKLLEKVEDRLAILQDPDPEKLEKFAALKKAYDHYRLMEKLIGEE